MSVFRSITLKYIKCTLNWVRRQNYLYDIFGKFKIGLLEKFSDGICFLPFARFIIFIDRFVQFENLNI